MRPRYSRLPSSRYRTRSPVLYNRSPLFPLNPSGTNFCAVNSARCKYPRANPSPPNHNSPATPTGTSKPCTSTTYARVFASGRPITTRPSSPRFISAHVEYVVSSLGPYRFNTRSIVSSSYNWSTTARLNASPARFTTRTPAGIPPSRTNSPITDGTVFTNRTASFPAHCGNASAFSARITCPPQLSGANISNTDRSKQIEVEANTPCNSSALNVSRAQYSSVTAL